MSYEAQLAGRSGKASVHGAAYPALNMVPGRCRSGHRRPGL